MAKTYIPNPDNKVIVHHKNHIKDDNRKDNLEWVSVSKNTKLGYENNDYHYTKKIEVYKNDNLIKIFNSIKKCAKYFDVHYSSISEIANNRRPIRQKGKIANFDFKIS